MQRTKAIVAGTAALFALCAWAGTAQAGLGEPVASVAKDRTVLGANALDTVTMPMYERHEMTTPGGTSVQEFAAHDGVVFAVNFSGPEMPDLKSVLGAHYETYMTAARARRGSHHLLSFEADGVVVTIVKSQRGFQGNAHVTAAVPRGVDVMELSR